MKAKTDPLLSHPGKVLFSAIWPVSKPVTIIGLAIYLVLPLVIIVILTFWLIVRREQKKRLNYESENSILKNEITRLSATNDWLLTEMHHRVKNNLQILSSLINSQLSFIKEKAGRDALISSKHRLYALSIVHQQLFENATGTSIEMTGCIKDIAYHLLDEFDCKSRIKVNLELTSLYLGSSAAMSFALIINELITNSLKYAFPNGRNGELKIVLSSRGNVTYQLIYSDDGIGLPENENFLSGGTLGKMLIAGLSKQIKATVGISNEHGFKITLDFEARQ